MPQREKSPTARRLRGAGCSDFVTRWEAVNGASKKLGQTSNKQSNHAVAVRQRSEATRKILCDWNPLVGKFCRVQVLDSFAKLFKVARNDGAKVRSQGSKPRFETKVRPERAVAGLFLDRPCYDFAFRFDDFS